MLCMTMIVPLCASRWHCHVCQFDTGHGPQAPSLQAPTDNFLLGVTGILHPGQHSVCPFVGGCSTLTPSSGPENTIYKASISDFGMAQLF